MTPPPSPGQELARAFFDDVVRPLLDAHFPGMRYAAGRLGTGSDVLGVDDAVSTDHDWGLRLALFPPRDRLAAVDGMLESALPEDFHGHPVRFAFTGSSTASHHVDVATVDVVVQSRLGFDPRDAPTPRDWLSLTGQSVLEFTAGPLFHDGAGEITAVRAALDWYPRDLWLQVLAADWHRIDQELPLLGRAGDVGDDRGSRIIAARLAQVTMHLAFLVERRWPPYAKWTGTLFQALPGIGGLAAALDDVLAAERWQERQDALARALDIVAARQQSLGLSRIASGTVPFWDRPFRHVHPEMISGLRAQIADPAVRALPVGRGSVEQQTDVVDILVDAAERRRMVGA